MMDNTFPAGQEETVQPAHPADGPSDVEKPPSAPDPKSFAMTKKVLLYAFLFFTLLLVAAVLDLVLAPINEAAVESITINFRNPRPEAEIVFSFDYGSLFSVVEPHGMACQLDSGEVEFQVTPSSVNADDDDDDDDNDDGKQADNRYLVHATCPEEDVESHAALIWELLTTNTTTKDDLLTSLIEHGTCEMRIHVRLGHIFPFAHSVEMPLEKLMAMGDAEVEHGDANEDDKHSDEESKLTVSASICHMDRETLDICIPLYIPSSSKSRLPSVVRLQLPSLQVHTKPTYTAGIVISMDAWEVEFDPEGDDTHPENSNEMTFTISSQDDLLPFYRPLIDIFLADVTSTTIYVTVDGEGSFLEILLGRNHQFNIQYSEQDAGDFQANYHRHLQEGRKATSSTTYQQTYSEAAAHCMRVTDNNDALGVGFCWLLEIPEERLTLVGNMTLYDTSISAISTTTWATNTDYVRVDMGSSVFVAGEDDLMDVVGGFLMDWSDKSNIQCDVTVENTGALWPFRAAILTTSSTEEVRFDLNLNEVTFLWEGEGIDGAQGGMTVNWGDYFAENFSMNARLDHGDSDFIDANLGMTEAGNEVFLLSGGSNCNWDGDDIWKLDMSFVLESDSIAEFDATQLRWAETIIWYVTANFKEIVTGKEVSLSGSFDAEDDGDIIVNGAFVHDLDDMITMQLALLFNEAENFVMRLGSNCTWDHEDIWRSSLSFSFDSIYSSLLRERRGSMEIELMEAISDFDVSISSTSLREGDGDLAMNTLIVHDGSDNISMQVDILFNEVEDFVIRAASTCFWDQDYIWASDLSVTWDWNDFTNGRGELTANINDIIRQFTMSSAVEIIEIIDGDTYTIELQSFLIQLVDEIYADSTGLFTIGIGNKLVLLDLEDNAHMDFVADIDFRWIGTGSMVGGEIETIDIRRGVDVFLDGTALFESEGDSSSLVLNFLMPTATRQLDADIRYFFDNPARDTFTMQIARIHYWWEDETYVDLTSHAVIGFEDYSIELSASDTGDVDFAGNFSAQIHSDDFFSGADIERVLLLSGSETYLDCFMSLGVEELVGGDVRIEIISDTTEESDLQMDTEMEMTWFDEDEALRMSLDHMILGWKGAIYLELPIGLSAPAPEPAPVPETLAFDPGVDHEVDSSGFARIALDTVGALVGLLVAFLLVT